MQNDDNGVERGPGRHFQTNLRWVDSNASKRKIICLQTCSIRSRHHDKWPFLALLKFDFGRDTFLIFRTEMKHFHGKKCSFEFWNYWIDSPDSFCCLELAITHLRALPKLSLHKKTLKIYHISALHKCLKKVQIFRLCRHIYYFVFIWFFVLIWARVINKKLTRLELFDLSPAHRVVSSVSTILCLCPPWAPAFQPRQAKFVDNFCVSWILAQFLALLFLLSVSISSEVSKFCHIYNTVL